MRDNPMHLAVFGDDGPERVELLGRMFGMMMPRQTEAFRATRDGELVGVCGAAPPGACIGAWAGSLGAMPPISEDAGVQARLGEWMGAWAARDSEIEHWHLGPVAADLDKQGQGIGSAMLEAFCAKVDDARAAAYLETDKPENVRFYERFGFQTTSEAEIVGTRSWFMARAAR
jgi:GNAT superfamily N-acetyltransferase